MQPEQLKRLFGENVKRRREEIGITRIELADQITDLGERIARHGEKDKPPKVHVQYIYEVEKGNKTPFLGNVALFAEALETTPDALLSSPPPPPSRKKIAAR